MSSVIVTETETIVVVSSNAWGTIGGNIADQTDLGTAATQDVGTSASNVVQLDGSARLPAVDGSQLTGLTPAQAGADPAGTAAAAVAAHESAPDPHPGYATDGDLSDHLGDFTNPHAVTAAQAGAEPTGAVATHAALTTTHGVTGALVGSTDAQELTNKTIDYSNNTLTGVQPTLVSGTSIKTINSTSLLGSGDIATGDVTLAGTQTLTNKTIAYASNTLTGVQAELVSGTSIKTINSTSLLGSGDITTGDVTLTGTQTLTNKTFTGYTETVYALSGTDISVSNGSIQTKTLSGNTTFTESLADGQSVVLMLDPSTYTVTWPTMTWINVAGSGAAPTLEASSTNVITMWQVGGTVYGNWAGSA